MNYKFTLLIAVILSTFVGIEVYFWQEEKISSLYEEVKNINGEKKLLEFRVNDLIDDLKIQSDKQCAFELLDENDSVDYFHFSKKNNQYFGKLLVKGYVTFQEVSEAFCEKDCPNYTYVFFKVLDTDNKYFQNYLDEMKGNSYINDDSIGLGCLKEGVLWRMNESDDYDMKEYKNSLDSSNEILKSTRKNPINLELEKYLFTFGRDAPTCYSHFAQVKVVE